MVICVCVCVCLQVCASVNSNISKKKATEAVDSVVADSK